MQQLPMIMLSQLDKILKLQVKTLLQLEEVQKPLEQILLLWVEAQKLLVIFHVLKHLYRDDAVKGFGAFAFVVDHVDGFHLDVIQASFFGLLHDVFPLGA